MATAASRAGAVTPIAISVPVNAEKLPIGPGTIAADNPLLTFVVGLAIIFGLPIM